MLPFEIIEIGAIKLDENLEIIDEFFNIISPCVYKKLHYKVWEIVQIGIEELKKKGDPFKVAADKFFEWAYMDGQEPVFCSWGSMDLMELQRNMAYFKVKSPFPYPLLYYDLQKIYNMYIETEDRNKAPLDRAVSVLGIPHERAFHRAIDDAWYAAMAMKSMHMEKYEKYLSLDYYRIPQNKEEEIELVFPSYAKFVSKGYATKDEVMEQANIRSLHCFRCKRKLRKKIRWFTSNQKSYYALGHCPEHGFVRGKINIKSFEKGCVYAIKTTKMIDDEKAALLRLKKEETEKKRRIKNRLKKLRKESGDFYE